MAKIRDHSILWLETKVRSEVPFLTDSLMRYSPKFIQIRETGADGKKPMKHFGRVRQELERGCVDQFLTAVEEALLPGASWNYHLDEDDVRSRVASRLSTLQESQLSLLLTSSEVNAGTFYFVSFKKNL